MTPAIIYIYPGTNVRRFLNKLHFILSTTIEKNTRSTLEPQRNDVHVGDHVLLREVFQKVLRQNRLIKWGFTEYVISFSTCRFKAVCIRNNEFSISANTRDSECSRTDNKGKQFFSLCGWMNTGTWPKINHSPSNKTTFCFFVSFTTVLHLFQSWYFR